MSQERTFLETLTTCRYLYNSALEERITKYKESKESVTYFDQCRTIKIEFQNEYQRKVYSQVLRAVLMRLHKSYQNFYRRLKNNEKPGFPKFKPDEKFNSFCYSQQGLKVLDNKKKIRLSKIGDVKIVWTRDLPLLSKIKTLTIKRDGDQWYVVLAVDCPDQVVKTSDKSHVGIDVGISKYLTLSDGTVIENPRILKQSERQLAKEQRKFSKKVKGSKNRNKQRIKVARTYRKVSNQRQDFQHKTSTWLVQNYGAIAFENLNIKDMVKLHSLAKHISDASWSQFILMTQYKAEEAGVSVVLVNPKDTTQNCSTCGKKVQKKLKDRVHDCPFCGLKMDRDLNASINILNRAALVQI